MMARESTKYRYRVAKGRGGYVLVLQQKLPGLTWETVKSSVYDTRSAAVESGKYMLRAWTRNPSKRSVRKRVSKALKKFLATQNNPPRVKGRKVKGGRAVTLRNFTGTVIKKGSQVIIRGKGRRK